MPNPSADFPGAIHTPTDISAFAGQKLGLTSPTHPAVEGKQEAEIVAAQTKLGYTTGAAQSPTTKKLLVGGTSAGTSKWGDLIDAAPTLVPGYVLGDDGSGGIGWVSPSAGAGETNTASNVNTAGVGVYDSKTGVNLNLKGVESSTGKLSVTDNTANKTVDLSVVESALALNSIPGARTIAGGGTGQTAKTPAYNALSPLSTLGDTEYHDGTNVVRLAGNTTAGKRFLRQTGTGSVSAAPAWDSLVAGDIPNLTASKITDFQSTAQGYTLDTFAAPTGNLNLNSNKIVSLADPTAAQDGATKAYVDAVAQGLSQKTTAYLATTTTLPTNTYSNGTAGVGATLTATANGALTIDGTAVPSGYEVLIKNEATGANNGLYVATSPGDVTHPYILTRATNFDTSAKILGSYVFVETGTVNVSAGFVVTNTALTLGTTAITFTQFSGAGEITASSGLSKSGNTLSAVGTTNRIAVGSGIDIDPAYIGQTSLTTLGTISAGTWQGTAVGPVYGGSGISSYVKGDLVAGSGTNTLAKLTVGTDGFALVADSTQTTGLKWAVAPKATADAVVAASGGDYTTVAAALAAGKKVIEVVGTVTETAAIDISALTGPFTIFGKSAQTCKVNLVNDNTKLNKFINDRLTVTGVTFATGSANLSLTTDAWIIFGGTNLLVDRNGFAGSGTAASTRGYMVAFGKVGVSLAELSRFTNNYFSNNNYHTYLVRAESYGVFGGQNCFDGNVFDNITTSGLLDIDMGAVTQDINGVSVSGNRAFYNGGNAVALIKVSQPNSGARIDGCYVCNNLLLSPSSGSASGIEVQNSGTVRPGQSIMVSGNTLIGNTSASNGVSSGNGSGTYASATPYDIKLGSVDGVSVVGNTCGNVLMSASKGVQINTNRLTGINSSTSTCDYLQVCDNYFFPTGATNQVDMQNIRYTVFSGNTSNAAGNFKFDSQTDCEFIGNRLASSTVTVGGSGASVIGNRLSTLTLSGTGQLYSANRTGTFTNTATSNVTVTNS